MSFRLDPVLEGGTVAVLEWPLCTVRLMNDARFPWCILVPRRGNIREIYELTPEDQQQLMRESVHLARTMAAHLKADKMNVAALGNVVPQLHVHHVARYTTDPAWPGAVFGTGPAVPYAPDEAARLVAALRDALGQP